MSHPRPQRSAVCDLPFCRPNSRIRITAAPTASIATRQGRTNRNTMGGKAVIHVRHSSSDKVITVEHDADETERDSVVSHYEGDYNNAFNYLSKQDGVTRLVRYPFFPDIEPLSNGRFRIITTLVEVSS